MTPTATERASTKFLTQIGVLLRLTRIDAHPAEYRALPVIAVGAGLRQGECFGVKRSAVDFLRRRLLVREQVKLVSGHGGPFLDLPKRGKVREVPLADSVSAALAEHMRLFPPGTDGLLFTGPDGGLLSRDRYNRAVWQPALRHDAGVLPHASGERGPDPARHRCRLRA